MAGRTIVTMMKDEAPFLLHWIAHHRRIGFDHIVVFTNDCGDGTDAMLDRLEAMGEVAHHRNKVPRDGKPQPLALRRALKLDVVAQSDWVIALDVDEYVTIKVGGGHLDDLLATAPQADGFALTWRMMGGCGLRDWTEAPVTEAYTRGAPDLFRKGWGVKTLFQPFDDMKLGIHRPTVKGRDKAALQARAWVNGSAKPMTTDFMDGMWRSSLATLGRAHAEIAHFATQSHEAFLRRAARGNVNAKPDKYNATYYAIFDRNETLQDALLASADGTRARVAGYLADPMLASLYARAMAWHATARDALRAAPGYAKDMAALKAAAATPYEALDDILFPQPLARFGKEMVARMQADGISDLQIARAVATSVQRAEAHRDAKDAQELQERGIQPDHGDWP